MSAFIILLHAHDHTWRSDWSSEIRVDTCRLLWNALIKNHENCENCDREYEAPLNCVHRIGMGGVCPECDPAERITNPTNEHREEAREIVEQFSLHKVQLIEPPTNRQYHFDFNELIDVMTSALSSRDAEVREVLEGLATHQIGSRRPCWCPPEYGSEPHTELCEAARALWAKLQPGKEREDVDKQTD